MIEHMPLATTTPRIARWSNPERTKENHKPNIGGFSINHTTEDKSHQQLKKKTKLKGIDRKNAKRIKKKLRMKQPAE